MSRPIPPPVVWPDPVEEAVAGRLWAAVMLARDARTCRSICTGKTVRAGNLDPFVLRRGLRGDALPDAEQYIDISVEMLDAIDEAGPLPEERPTSANGRERVQRLVDRATGRERRG